MNCWLLFLLQSWPIQNSPFWLCIITNFSLINKYNCKFAPLMIFTRSMLFGRKKAGCLLTLVSKAEIQFEKNKSIDHSFPLWPPKLKETYPYHTKECVVLGLHFLTLTLSVSVFQSLCVHMCVCVLLCTFLVWVCVCV